MSEKLHADHLLRSLNPDEHNDVHCHSEASHSHHDAMPLADENAAPK